MKRVHFVLQSKGGVGKSTYTYMLANLAVKNEIKSLFIDMDNETDTSLTQLGFIGAKTFNLVDHKTKQIDRTKIDSFFQGIIEQDKYSSIICDLGATSSEQFLKYLENPETKDIMQALGEMGIELNLHCILGGDNTFPACSNFCSELFAKTKTFAKNFIVRNELYNYSDAQEKNIKQISKAVGAPINSFNLINESGSSSLNEVLGLMENGVPAISDAQMFTKIRFKTNLEKLVFEF